MKLRFVLVLLVGFCSLGITLKEQNELLFKQLKDVHKLNDEQMKKIKDIFSKAGYMGQGNPDITKHPMTVQECKDKVKKAGVKYENKDFEKVCGHKYMAPLYNPDSQKPEDATACIDQFEFPNIPCEYPVVWVRANEAVEICEAMGKRLCDAHEWEGACDGKLLDPDYDFQAVKSLSGPDAFRKLRSLNNAKTNATKRWSYGPTYKTGICASNSFKHDGCDGGNWKKCGSNTYPVGSFPECVSPLKVYDIHGNAAEHMNLPTKPEEMSTHSSKAYGHTEMKGSWFIFDKFKAHEDYCRWRAPYWHGSRVKSKDSHHNYHLGFRCCNTVTAKPTKK